MTSSASSKPRQSSLGNSSSPARLRLVLLALVAAAFFLAPAAQAVAAEYPLEVEVSGEGNVGCTADGGPVEGCEAEFEEGTEVTVIAEPEPGSEFLEWLGDCDSTVENECEVEMNEAKTIEAVFGFEEFELTVATEGNGEGVVECEVEFGPTEPCPASETYAYGTEVTLYAESEPGSQFLEWGGDCSGEEAECELTVEEPLGVIATFEPGPFFALNIEEPGTGEGTITCEVNAGPAEPCEAEYVEGTVVTLRAEAKPGSEFLEWLGECDAASGNECEVEVNEERTVEAVFDARPAVSLTVTNAGTGTGKVECKVNGGSAEPCEIEYPEGTELALVATAEAGSKFAGYSAGTGSATACATSPCSFTLEANSAVTATFTANSKEEVKKEEPKKEEPKPTPEGSAKAAATATVKSGKASLKLTCSGGPCKGTIQLKAKVKQGKKTKNLAIGKASFSLADGATTTLKVKLSGPAKQELAKGKTLKAKTSGSGVTASTVKLKLKKK